MIALPLAAGAAAVGASCRWNWWRPKVSGGMPTLMYHKIGDCPKDSNLGKLWVTTAEFRRQMLFLKKRGYTALTFAQWRDAQDGKAALPSKPILVTFDDGYANNYVEAYPVLKDLGMKGNIFLVYETMDHHNAWHDPAGEPWIPMLTWAQIKEMQDSGVMEMGSHTMRHRNLGQLGPDDVRWELGESKKRLEDKLGREMVGFAYPYGAGAYKTEVRQAAREAGYRFDFGIKQGISPARWQPADGPIKRLFIRGDDSMFDFFLNVTRGKARF